MRAWLAAFLLLLSILAGCASNDSSAPPTGGLSQPKYGSGFSYVGLDAGGHPIPSLLCRPSLPGAADAGGRCNFDMTPDEGRQGNEVTIAVNPKDARNVVGGAKDYYPADAGQCVWDGVYVTHDGFATATEDRSFDGSPWRLLSDDPTSYTPTYASQFWCTTDPVAYFDVNGNLYYLLMAYQADPVTGGDTCAGVCPQGAFNDWAFNRATQIVAISSDGGDTFHTFTAVFEGGSYPVLFNDKGWVAASADGTVHVMWLASVGGGNMYFRSTDGGKSYGLPQFLSSTPDAVASDAGQGSFVDVGTGSQVYAMWTGSSITLRRSTDTGATFLPAQQLLAPHDATMPGLSDRDRRGSFPALATDRNPDSPYADAVYVVFADTCVDATWSEDCTKGEGSRIYLMSSFDQGVTFGTPVRVSGPEEVWRIFPAVSVSPGGVLDLSWMQQGARVAPASNTFDDNEPHATFEQDYSYSLDAGATWSTEFSVRDANDGGWDPALSHHQNGKIFLGDYNDIDSSWQAAHPVWPDTRDGAHVKVYTATIERPWFANGWDPKLRDAADADAAAHKLS